MPDTNSEVTLLAAALHESGHLLCGVRLGLTVARVSIERSASEAGHTEFGSPRDREVLTRLTMEADRGNKTARKLLAIVARVHALSSLAGPSVDLLLLENRKEDEAVVSAVRACVGRPLDALISMQSRKDDTQAIKQFLAGAWPDLEAVYQMAARMTNAGGPSVFSIASRLFVQAEAWVRQPKVWESITLVSNHLVERRTIEGADVTAMAKELLQRAGEPVGSPNL